MKLTKNNKPKLNLLSCFELSIFEQLQLEEALLRASHENWFIINFGTTPSVVCGAFGKVSELVNEELAKELKIPIIRRFSGGGTVVVDESTFFTTFIMNAKELKVQPFPKSIMEWTGKIFAPCFHPLKFSLNENDYTLEREQRSALKIGGNAQSITKDRWLHHTSFLWDFKPELMQLLLFPKKTPDYRKGRAHTEFITTLSDKVSSHSDLSDSIINELSSIFSVEKVLISKALPFLDMEYRKSTQYVFHPELASENMKIISS